MAGPARTVCTFYFVLSHEVFKQFNIFVFSSRTTACNTNHLSGEGGEGGGGTFIYGISGPHAPLRNALPSQKRHWPASMVAARKKIASTPITISFLRKMCSIPGYTPSCPLQNAVVSLSFGHLVIWPQCRPYPFPLSFYVEILKPDYCRSLFFSHPRIS